VRIFRGFCPLPANNCYNTLLGRNAHSQPISATITSAASRPAMITASNHRSLGGHLITHRSPWDPFSVLTVVSRRRKRAIGMPSFEQLHSGSSGRLQVQYYE
jgi:hypothetical protein